MIVKLDVIDSTNEEAKRNHALYSHGTVICARSQTAGRGRFSRTWYDKPGDSLLMSILYKENISALLPLRAGLAVLDAISAVGVKNLALKWPNDVFVSGKKICGILCEGVPGAYAVVGIGVNIGQTDFPQELSSIATSLFLEGAKGIDSQKLLLDIKNRLSALLFVSDSDVISAYRVHCLNIGKSVTAGDVCGKCLDVLLDGSLLVNTANGNKAVNSGEVCIYED